MSVSINQDGPFSGVKQKVVPAALKSSQKNAISLQTKSIDDKFISEEKSLKDRLSNVSELQSNESPEAD